MATKYDRASFAACLREAIEGDFAPHNPVLVWNSTTGKFSIQSDLCDMHDDEHVAPGQLDTSESPLSAWTDGLKASECDRLAAEMSEDVFDSMFDD